MNKTFKELGFKAGDKVKCVESKYSIYEVGKVYTLEDWYSSDKTRQSLVITGNWNGSSAIWEKVEDMFEDQWHLNDGKVEIPGDADKLEKDGSVVAFRYRKAKPFEFGEKLRIKKSLWPSDVINTRNINPGLDYVDAVYISKYFDLNGVKGIKVYVNNGEKSWECCFTDLGKVERLT